MNKILDYSGTLLSWTCAAHCLAMPFIAGALPLFGFGFLEDKAAEWILIGASLSIALMTLLPSYFRRHGKIIPTLLFLAGMALILSGHYFFEDEFWQEASLIFAGALSISAAHLLNMSFCKECSQGNCNHAAS